MRKRMHRTLPVLRFGRRTTDDGRPAYFCCLWSAVCRLIRPIRSHCLIAGILAGLLPSWVTAYAQPYKQVRGIIHLDTTISGGEYDPEEMVRFLKDHKLEVAIFSDQITTRVKYGTFPAPYLMEWVTGRFVTGAFDRRGSVATFGPDKYLSLLNELDRQYPDVVIIPGVEAFPYYYWEGSLLRNTLTMRNGYKHLLAIGMESPHDYRDMPTTGEGFFRRYNIHTLLSLWPLSLLYFGYKCWRQVRRSLYPHLFKLSAMVFLAVGGLFMLHNYPYKFDRYSGNAGYAPYQDFIDYVADRGGLVFWAHPEVASEHVYAIGPLKITQKTGAPYEDLLYVHNYTGFAAFYEGMKYVIPPGGIWDQVLTQYCLGQRARPVWAIAEGDVEGDAFDPRLSQTVFLVNQKTRKDVLESLIDGRVYALSGPYAHALRLESIELSGNTQSAGLGQTIEASSVHLSARIVLDGNEKHALSADLIKNGAVVQTFRGENELAITYSDSLQRTDRLHYYRIDVRAPNQSRLLTNPIFVRVPQGP